jgi:glycosyltransferase involved in cell wall biosynthesis
MKSNSVSLDEYVLITPVKNEENNLPEFFRSVLSQTIRPLLWVIVDDGSTDRSSEIIDTQKEKCTWINVIRLPDNGRNRGIHLSSVMTKGFNYATEYCKKNELEFDYYVSFDADAIYEKTYIEKLLQKFKENPVLGVAGGGDWFVSENKAEFSKKYLPSSGGMMIRKKCFQEIGGIQISYSIDSIINAKAQLKGWETKRFNEIRAFRTRGMCEGGEGLWAGYMSNGEGHYFINYNALYAFAKGLTLFLKKPYYIGPAFLWGYFNSLIFRKEQIKDDEIKNYFWHGRPRALNRYYFDKFRKKIKFFCL